jgi:hypothetical protein
MQVGDSMRFDCIRVYGRAVPLVAFPPVMRELHM